MKSGKERSIEKDQFSAQALAEPGRNGAFKNDAFEVQIAKGLLMGIIK